MKKIIDNIKSMNINRGTLEPLFTDATVAAIKDTFNIVATVAALTDKKELTSFLFPNLYSVLFKEESRRLILSIEAIKKNKKGNDKNAIPNLLLIAVNNYEVFKSLEKDLLLIGGDKEWNATVVEAHDSNSVEEIIAIGEARSWEEAT